MAAQASARFGDRLVRCFAERPPSVHAMFERSLARGPEREALVFEDRRWSWSELDAAAGRLAASLADDGLVAGERVAMLLSNRPEFVTTLLALLRLGAIAVPV